MTKSTEVNPFDTYGEAFAVNLDNFGCALQKFYSTYNQISKLACETCKHRSIEVSIAYHGRREILKCIKITRLTKEAIVKKWLSLIKSHGTWASDGISEESSKEAYGLADEVSGFVVSMMKGLNPRITLMTSVSGVGYEQASKGLCP